MTFGREKTVLLLTLAVRQDFLPLQFLLLVYDIQVHKYQLFIFPFFTPSWNV